MEEKQVGRTIYLKDLVFAALYCWKWILVVALVFGLLLGGMEYFSSNDPFTLDGTSLTPQYEDKIEHLEKSIIRTEKNIALQSTYLENSVYMRLDPFEAYTAGIYIVPVLPEDSTDTAATERINSILRSYRNLFIDSDTMASLGQQFQMSSDNITELITFDVVIEGYMGITARGASREEADAIAAALEKIVRDNLTRVSNETETHTVQLLSFHVGPKYDAGLYESQEAAHQKLTNLRNSLIASQTELDKLLPTELIPGAPKPVLLAIIGIFLGACLVMAVVWFRHIACNKVYSVRTLKDRTGIRVLGCVCADKKAGPVKRRLRKLEGRWAYGKTDAVTANLRNRCQGVKTLLLLGNYPKEVLADMTDALAQSGITCLLQDDPASSAAVLEALPGCDAVALVETCNVSNYDHVIWEAETVADHEKPLLGCILING